MDGCALTESCQNYVPIIRTVDERVAIVEERMRGIEQDHREIREKVGAMHDLLMRARGARWAILAVVGLGAFAAGIMEKLLSLHLFSH